MSAQRIGAAKADKHAWTPGTVMAHSGASCVHVEGHLLSK